MPGAGSTTRAAGAPCTGPAGAGRGATSAAYATRAGTPGGGASRLGHRRHTGVAGVALVELGPHLLLTAAPQQQQHERVAPSSQPAW